jgi:hypothetical protein
VSVFLRSLDGEPRFASAGHGPESLRHRAPLARRKSQPAVAAASYVQKLQPEIYGQGFGDGILEVKSEVRICKTKL